jgi:hypothetical protein
MFSKIRRLVGNLRLDHEPGDTPQVNMFNAKNININNGSFIINNSNGGGQRLRLHFCGQLN